jgi:hypothetical protein
MSEVKRQKLKGKIKKYLLFAFYLFTFAFAFWHRPKRVLEPFLGRVEPCFLRFGTLAFLLLP